MSVVAEIRRGETVAKMRGKEADARAIETPQEHLVAHPQHPHLVDAFDTDTRL